MKTTSIGTALLALLGFIALFFFASEVIIPLVFAIFLFFLLDPLIDQALITLKLPRVVSSPILVILSFVLFCGTGWSIYGGVVGIADQVPKYSEKIKGVVQSFEDKASDLRKDAKNIFSSEKPESGSQLNNAPASDSGSGFTSTLLHGVSSAFSVLVDLFLIPILCVFFLLDREHLKTHFKKSLGSHFPLERVTSEIGSMVKGYFIGNFAVGLVTALLFYILFAVLGLDHKFSLALLSGFINLIPLFGAVLSPALPAAQAFLQFDNFNSVTVILGTAVFLHFFVNNWVLPKIVGSRINVNASAATLGLMFWGWLWGGSGLLLAIPLTALIRIGLSAFPQTESWSQLIAEGAHKRRSRGKPESR